MVWIHSPLYCIEPTANLPYLWIRFALNLASSKMTLVPRYHTGRSIRIATSSRWIPTILSLVSQALLHSYSSHLPPTSMTSTNICIATSQAPKPKRSHTSCTKSLVCMCDPNYLQNCQAYKAQRYSCLHFALHAKSKTLTLIRQYHKFL